MLSSCDEDPTAKLFQWLDLYVFYAFFGPVISALSFSGVHSVVIALQPDSLRDPAVVYECVSAGLENTSLCRTLDT